MRLAGALLARGYEAEVIVTQEEGGWFGELERRRIPVQRIQGFRAEEFGAPLRHVRRVAQALNGMQHDVLLLNQDPFAQAALPLLSREKRVAVVFHNDLERVYRLSGANPNSWDAAVAVGRKIAAEVQRRLPGKPMREIRHGVELPADDAWRRRCGHGTPIQLVYVGRLNQEQKGILFLPRIMEELRHMNVPARLTVVGTGEDEVRLRSALESRHLQAMVTLHGAAAPDDVYAILLRSHALLLPSFFEGFPITPLEAQACGCVPVVSRLAGVTDVAVTDGVHGCLVPVGDVSGFAAAIARLARDPVAWQSMSVASHERMRREYPISAMADQYEALIRELTNASPAGLARGGSWSRVDWRLFEWKEFLPRRIRRGLGRVARGAS
jgi:glycosyltransferase involved in cell wall biosynthesis